MTTSKLLQLRSQTAPAGIGSLTQRYEFYEINESGSNPGLDNFAAQKLLTRPCS